MTDRSEDEVPLLPLIVSPPKWSRQLDTKEPRRCTARFPPTCFPPCSLLISADYSVSVRVRIQPRIIEAPSNARQEGNVQPWSRQPSKQQNCTSSVVDHDSIHHNRQRRCIAVDAQLCAEECERRRVFGYEFRPYETPEIDSLLCDAFGLRGSCSCSFG
jgi:hypothetical protein